METTFPSTVIAGRFGTVRLKNGTDVRKVLDDRVDGDDYVLTVVTADGDGVEIIRLPKEGDPRDATFVLKSSDDKRNERFQRGFRNGRPVWNPRDFYRLKVKGRSEPYLYHKGQKVHEDDKYYDFTDIHGNLIKLEKKDIISGHWTAESELDDTSRILRSAGMYIETNIPRDRSNENPKEDFPSKEELQTEQQQAQPTTVDASYRRPSGEPEEVSPQALDEFLADPRNQAYINGELPSYEGGSSTIDLPSGRSTPEATTSRVSAESPYFWGEPGPNGEAPPPITVDQIERNLGRRLTPEERDQAVFYAELSKICSQGYLEEGPNRIPVQKEVDGSSSVLIPMEGKTFKFFCNGQLPVEVPTPAFDGQYLQGTCTPDQPYPLAHSQASSIQNVAAAAGQVCEQKPDYSCSKDFGCNVLRSAFHAATTIIPGFQLLNPRLQADTANASTAFLNDLNKSLTEVSGQMIGHSGTDALHDFSQSSSQDIERAIESKTGKCANPMAPSCASSIVNGILKDVAGSISGLVELAGNAIHWGWKKLKGLFVSDDTFEHAAVNSLEDRTSQTANALNKLSPQEIEAAKKDKPGFLARMASGLMDWAWKGMTETFACEEWGYGAEKVNGKWVAIPGQTPEFPPKLNSSGEPMTDPSTGEVLKESDPVRKCVKVPPTLACATCNQKINMFCGMVGIAGGEIISSFLMGFGIGKLAEKGGKLVSFGERFALWASKSAEGTGALARLERGAQLVSRGALTAGKITLAVGKGVAQGVWKVAGPVFRGARDVLKYSYNWLSTSKIPIVSGLFRMTVGSGTEGIRYFLRLNDRAFMAGFQTAQKGTKGFATGLRAARVAEHVADAERFAYRAEMLEKSLGHSKLISEKTGGWLLSGRTSRLEQEVAQLRRAQETAFLGALQQQELMRLAEAAKGAEGAATSEKLGTTLGDRFKKAQHGYLDIIRPQSENSAFGKWIDGVTGGNQGKIATSVLENRLVDIGKVVDLKNPGKAVEALNGKVISGVSSEHGHQIIHLLDPENGKTAKVVLLPDEDLSVLSKVGSLFKKEKDANYLAAKLSDISFTQGSKFGSLENLSKKVVELDKAAKALEKANEAEKVAAKAKLNEAIRDYVSERAIVKPESSDSMRFASTDNEVTVVRQGSHEREPYELVRINEDGKVVLKHLHGPNKGSEVAIAHDEIERLARYANPDATPLAPSPLNLASNSNQSIESEIIAARKSLEDALAEAKGLDKGLDPKEYLQKYKDKLAEAEEKARDLLRKQLDLDKPKKIDSEDKLGFIDNAKIERLTDVPVRFRYSKEDGTYQTVFGTIRETKAGGPNTLTADKIGITVETSTGDRLFVNLVSDSNADKLDLSSLRRATSEEIELVLAGRADMTAAEKADKVAKVEQANRLAELRKQNKLGKIDNANKLQQPSAPEETGEPIRSNSGPVERTTAGASEPRSIDELAKALREPGAAKDKKLIQEIKAALNKDGNLLDIILGKSKDSRVQKLLEALRGSRAAERPYSQKLAELADSLRRAEGNREVRRLAERVAKLQSEAADLERVQRAAPGTVERLFRSPESRPIFQYEKDGNQVLVRFNGLEKTPEGPVLHVTRPGGVKDTIKGDELRSLASSVNEVTVDSKGIGSIRPNGSNEVVTGPVHSLFDPKKAQASDEAKNLVSRLGLQAEIDKARGIGVPGLDPTVPVATLPDGAPVASASSAKTSTSAATAAGKAPNKPKPLLDFPDTPIPKYRSPFSSGNNLVYKAEPNVPAGIRLIEDGDGIVHYGYFDGKIRSVDGELGFNFKTVSGETKQVAFKNVQGSDRELVFQLRDRAGKKVGAPTVGQITRCEGKFCYLRTIENGKEKLSKINIEAIESISIGDRHLLQVSAQDARFWEKRDTSVLSLVDNGDLPLESLSLIRKAEADLEKARKAIGSDSLLKKLFNRIRSKKSLEKEAQALDQLSQAYNEVLARKIGLIDYTMPLADDVLPTAEEGLRLAESGRLQLLHEKPIIIKPSSKPGHVIYETKGKLVAAKDPITGKLTIVNADGTINVMSETNELLRLSPESIDLAATRNLYENGSYVSQDWVVAKTESQLRAAGHQNPEAIEAAQTHLRKVDLLDLKDLRRRNKSVRKVLDRMVKNKQEASFKDLVTTERRLQAKEGLLAELLNVEKQGPDPLTKAQLAAVYLEKAKDDSKFTFAALAQEPAGTIAKRLENTEVVVSSAAKELSGQKVTLSLDSSTGHVVTRDGKILVKTSSGELKQLELHEIDMAESLKLRGKDKPSLKIKVSPKVNTPHIDPNPTIFGTPANDGAAIRERVKLRQLAEKPVNPIELNVQTYKTVRAEQEAIAKVLGIEERPSKVLSDAEILSDAEALKGRIPSARKDWHDILDGQTVWIRNKDLSYTEAKLRKAPIRSPAMVENSVVTPSGKVRVEIASPGKKKTYKYVDLDQISVPKAPVAESSLAKEDKLALSSASRGADANSTSRAAPFVDNDGNHIFVMSTRDVNQVNNGLSELEKVVASTSSRTDLERILSGTEDLQKGLANTAYSSEVERLRQRADALQKLISEKLSARQGLTSSRGSKNTSTALARIDLDTPRLNAQLAKIDSAPSSFTRLVNSKPVLGKSEIETGLSKIEQLIPTEASSRLEDFREQINQLDNILQTVEETAQVRQIRDRIKTIQSSIQKRLANINESNASTKAFDEGKDILVLTSKDVEKIDKDISDLKQIVARTNSQADLERILDGTERLQKGLATAAYSSDTQKLRDAAEQLRQAIATKLSRGTASDATTVSTRATRDLADISTTTEGSRLAITDAKEPFFVHRPLSSNISTEKELANHDKAILEWEKGVLDKLWPTHKRKPKQAVVGHSESDYKKLFRARQSGDEKQTAALEAKFRQKASTPNSLLRKNVKQVFLKDSSEVYEFAPDSLGHVVNPDGTLRLRTKGSNGEVLSIPQDRIDIPKTREGFAVSAESASELAPSPKLANHGNHKTEKRAEQAEKLKKAGEAREKLREARQEAREGKGSGEGHEQGERSIASVESTEKKKAQNTTQTNPF